VRCNEVNSHPAPPHSPGRSPAWPPSLLDPVVPKRANSLKTRRDAMHRLAVHDVKPLICDIQSPFAVLRNIALASH
jgi:hypothetical protein